MWGPQHSRGGCSCGTEPKQRFDADGKMLLGEAVLGDGGGGRLLSLRLPKVSKVTTVLHSFP